MQLQVLKMSRTPLIIEENVKKRAVFWTILTKLTFSWIINEIYVNILIFVYGCTHNTPRIPKIYNIIGIWSTDQKLLTVKPIATLRYTTTMKWNETRSAEALKIYDHLTDQMLKILSLPHWLNDKLLKILSLSWIII